MFFPEPPKFLFRSYGIAAWSREETSNSTNSQIVRKPEIVTIFILLILSFLGLILLFLGLAMFVKSIRRHPHLLRIQGAILSVDEKYYNNGDEPGVTFYPIIGYTTPEDQRVRFRSKWGTTRRVRFSRNPTSPWREGQSIDVFHDPRGEMDPCVASLWHLYGMSLSCLTGGILLLMIVVNKWNHLGG